MHYYSRGTVSHSRKARVQPFPFVEDSRAQAFLISEIEGTS